MFGRHKYNATKSEVSEATSKADELINIRKEHFPDEDPYGGFSSKEALIRSKIAGKRMYDADTASRGVIPAGDSPAFYQMPTCKNCGRPADHHHGKHGCCGGQGCHMKLFLAHTAYGEGGVNRFMRRNWPSIR